MGHESSRDLHRFAEDHLWVNEHLESLLDRYAEQWIAVKDRKVVASDLDLDQLVAKVSDPEHTCIEFVTREPLEMVL